LNDQQMLQFLQGHRKCWKVGGADWKEMWISQYIQGQITQ